MIDKITNIKVSIIVPIWNAGERIRRCLDTLLNQSLKEIEVVCVLDCPTDGCDLIVEEYAKKDNRVVVLRNEENLHVSESRNRGLAIARGEYIGFSDHDDYRENMQMYELLYWQAIKDDADVVVSDAVIRYHNPMGEAKDEYWCFSDLRLHELITANILPLLKCVNQQMISHCVWSSIYRREFIISHSIKFRDRSVFLDEDRLFNFEAYLNANHISQVSQAFYVWEQFADSVSNTQWSRLAERQINRTSFYVDYLKNVGLYKEYKMVLWRLLALEMKVYVDYYKQLGCESKKKLGLLMQSMDYPIYGGGYGLKFISKKRLMLIGLNVEARLLCLRR